MRTIDLRVTAGGLLQDPDLLFDRGKRPPPVADRSVAIHLLYRHVRRVLPEPPGHREIRRARRVHPVTAEHTRPGRSEGGSYEAPDFPLEIDLHQRASSLSQFRESLQNDVHDARINIAPLPVVRPRNRNPRRTQIHRGYRLAGNERVEERHVRYRARHRSDRIEP